MFKSKSKKMVGTDASPVTSNENSNQICNNIAPGTHIEGKFISSEDLRLDGRITGEVLCAKKMVMGEHGHMNGDVVSEDASIRGKIMGTLKVKGLLHLLTTAHLEGKIMAKKMIVDEGASYSGECLIGEQHVK